MAKNKKSSLDADLSAPVTGASHKGFENIESAGSIPVESQEPITEEASVDGEAFENAQTKSERLFAYNTDVEGREPAEDEQEQPTESEPAADETAAPVADEPLTEATEKAADEDERQPLDMSGSVLEHLRVIGSYQPVTVPKFRDMAGLSQNAVFLLWEYEREGLVSREYRNSAGVWSLTEKGQSLIG